MPGLKRTRRSRKLRNALIVVLALALFACGGAGDSTSGGSDTGEGTPFEGIGEAAEGVELLDAGPVTATADPGHTWVEVDGQRLEFNDADSEVLDCVINDEQLSVIYRNEDGSEVRLSGLLLPDGWNLSLTVYEDGNDVLNGASLRGGNFGIEDKALSYEGSVDVLEAGQVTAQVNTVLAANCSE